MLTHERRARGWSASGAVGKGGAPGADPGPTEAVLRMDGAATEVVSIHACLTDIVLQTQGACNHGAKAAEALWMYSASHSTRPKARGKIFGKINSPVVGRGGGVCERRDPAASLSMIRRWQTRSVAAL
jgi:hypothetical protein